jgi:hypothetical protein
MWTGKQFSGTLNAGGSGRWFTFGWPADWHVVWYMMPTSPQAGAPQLSWDVAVERANSTQCSYWLTVTNLTGNTVDFEGRFAVFS